MRIPDWIVYILALGVVLFVFLPNDEDAMAPEAPPQEAVRGEGRPLPPPSAFDERILVQTDEPMDGTGSAFAMNQQGQWLTARHVVDGCDDIALEVQPGTLVPVRAQRLSEEADLAVLYTGRAPKGLPVDPNRELTIGTQGFHIGFPQGQPGEATSKLLSRSRLIIRGERRSEENVLAWAEQGRTRNLNGSLGGLSGGPVLSADGQVIGVTIAESPRRGRIYTTSPATLAKFLADVQVENTDASTPRPVTVANYGREADRLRRAISVVKVVCRVE
jgi:serine protease Do